MNKLTKERLASYSHLPDNAYLDSRDLQEILEVTNLGLHIQHGYLPVPSELHKTKKQSSKNRKIYWKIGELRAFVTKSVEQKTQSTISV